jgi:hypothetical protein
MSICHQMKIGIPFEVYVKYNCLTKILKNGIRKN